MRAGALSGDGGRVRRYAALAGGGGGEATLRGLELATGGKARELPVAPGAEADALWAALQEAHATNQVVGARVDAEAGGEAARDAESLGLVPSRTYCVVTSGDMQSPAVGRLIKLRGFAGEPEWNGKWSDGDDSWTTFLRQQLSYSKDSNDGTFWISLADFATHFTSAFATQVSDDRFTRLTVRSRWMGQSAGGGPAFASWRDNYQWRLSVRRAVSLTLSLTLPEGGGVPPPSPVGLIVVRANAAPDAARRRLRLTEGSEVVAHAEPLDSRKLRLQLDLAPTPADSPCVGADTLVFAAAAAALLFAAKAAG